MYRLRIFYFGEKRVVLKDSSSRSRFWSKLAGITREMEGENTMEKHLKVFRAHSLKLLAVRSHLAFQYVAPRMPDGLTPKDNN